MNLLFLTQSSSLELFWELAEVMRRRTGPGRTGFYVAGAEFYESFCRRRPELESGQYPVLKEWEILAEAARSKPDIERLRREEDRLGDPVLWNALVADRRIYLGKRAVLKQDYAPASSPEQMLAVLDTAQKRLAALFDQVQPDLVAGFICVTIGDYLAYREAVSRGITYLNLRPTRVRNYFQAGDSIYEPSVFQTEAYEKFLSDSGDQAVRAEAREILETVRSSHAMYEGVVPTSPPGTAQPSSDHPARPSALARLRLRIKQARRFSIAPYSHDSHYQGPLYPAFFGRIERPLRRRLHRAALKRANKSLADLAGADFAFYPLHKEPEVTLLVYSRPYMNQIEVVRNIAMSLPLGVKLVVKEHPACVGYRSLGYYRKLLDIPGVVLVPPETSGRELVEKARFTAIISGSIGLEALMLGKPVLHFGQVPFCVLPDSMIRRNSDPMRLAEDIAALLKSHKHQPKAMEAYVAAVIATSTPVDFYSRLLRRGGVYRPDSEEEDRSIQVARLADYLLDRFNRTSGPSPLIPLNR